MSLQTEYKYIDMELAEIQMPKTKVYNILAKSSGDYLGKIRWYANWRQYTFFPAHETIFSKGCMVDINNFIEQLMNERKTRQGERLP